MRFPECEEQSQVGQAADEARLATGRQNCSVEWTQYLRDPESKGHVNARNEVGYIR